MYYDVLCSLLFCSINHSNGTMSYKFEPYWSEQMENDSDGIDRIVT